MIPPHKHHQEENLESWLMSYADMITLLLCFFVIFVAVSEPKKDRFTAVTEGMLGKFGTVEMSTPFQGIFRSLEAIVETHQILKDIAIEKGSNSLAMEVSSLSFYKDKTADFDDKMLPVLSELADALRTMPLESYRITVAGYTNDLPVKTPYFPSNWELSAARAARMVRFFIEHGVPANRLRAVGYGDTDPKVPNLDIDGNPIPANRKQNERVVILIEQAK